MKLREFIKDGAMKAVETNRAAAYDLICVKLYGKDDLKLHHKDDVEQAVIEKVGKAKYAQALNRIVTHIESVEDSVSIVARTSNNPGWVKYRWAFGTDALILLITATPQQRLAAMLIALASLEG